MVILAISFLLSPMPGDPTSLIPKPMGMMTGNVMWWNCATGPAEMGPPHTLEFVTTLCDDGAPFVLATLRVPSFAHLRRPPSIKYGSKLL